MMPASSLGENRCRCGDCNKDHDSDHEYGAEFGLLIFVHILANFIHIYNN